MAQKGVLAITGTGGVAIAVARRLGSGRVIAIGSRSRENLQKTKETLESEGHDVKTFQADMRDQASIENFAKEAAALGPVEVVVHTSGISPSQADSVGTILETNLLGTMYVIDAFEQNIAPGGSLVVVSSMGAHMLYLFPSPDAELQYALATCNNSDLIKNPQHKTFNTSITDKGHTYCYTKFANNLRVEGKAVSYAQRGARINSVSPGLIMTRMGHDELNGPNREQIEQTRDACPLGRASTPDDVVNCITFLAGRESAFVNGTDLRCDGGTVPAAKWYRPLPEELTHTKN